MIVDRRDITQGLRGETRRRLMEDGLHRNIVVNGLGERNSPILLPFVNLRRRQRRRINILDLQDMRLIRIAIANDMARLIVLVSRREKNYILGLGGVHSNELVLLLDVDVVFLSNGTDGRACGVLYGCVEVEIHVTVHRVGGDLCGNGQQTLFRSLNIQQTRQLLKVWIRRGVCGSVH